MLKAFSVLEIFIFCLDFLFCKKGLNKKVKVNSKICGFTDRRTNNYNTHNI